jgi:hypothetical protein
MNWFDKIIEIIHNSSNYDNIRENGYIKGNKYYQWKEFASKIDEIVNKI